MSKVFGSDTNAYKFCNSAILIREYFTEIVAYPVLTPSIVERAYKHVSGICCCHLQGGSE